MPPRGSYLAILMFAFLDIGGREAGKEERMDGWMDERREDETERLGFSSLTPEFREQYWQTLKTKTINKHQFIGQGRAGLENCRDWGKDKKKKRERERERERERV